MNMKQRPLVGMVAGDPHGVGSELVIKALVDTEIRSALIPVVIGSPEHFRRTQQAIGIELEIVEIAAPKDAQGAEGTLEIIPSDDPDWNLFQWGQTSEMAGRVSISHLRQVANLALEGQVDALVYAPLHKGNMKQAGLGFPSEAEFLQDLTNAGEIVIFLVGKRTMVTRVTTHVPFKDVPRYITQDSVLRVIRMTNDSLRKLSYESPSIGVAALNPHMGEGGLCGTEEIDSIIPAIEAARAEGISVRDLLPADTLHLAFAEGALGGRIDAGIYMYHDIAGLCSKIMEAFDMFTFTVGLPFPVFTPGHGTRYRRAGKGTADIAAMKNALLMAGRTKPSNVS